jgi:endonuclease YncB( thermonuclease family)
MKKISTLICMIIAAGFVLFSTKNTDNTPTTPPSQHRITGKTPHTVLDSTHTSVQPQSIITGKVVRVADGDTIILLDAQNKQTKIRFYGIDAPEKAQDFGEVSRKYLANMLAGKNVVATVVNIDQYDRYVSRIKFGDKEVAEEMLKAGMVWVYTSFCDIPECKRWKQLATQARNAKIGLWANPHAQKPWRWRQENK